MARQIPSRFPTLFIPHGGGPCFFMESVPPGLWNHMGAYLSGIDAALGARPSAVLVVSGHWEAARPTVNVAPRPALLFDYQGFPEETYRLTYPVAGSPELGARVQRLLADADIESDQEAGRDLDHGVFVPFKMIYPAADVPMVQLSLDRSRSAATHLAIGRALAPLRDEGILIVGSGMSYHNLRELFADTDRANRSALDFDRWLHHTLTLPDAAERNAALLEWEQAPGARTAHPTPEHLLPLLVAAGAADAEGDAPGRRTYNDMLYGKAISGFQFGAGPV